jgi:hypothetical protein
MKKRKEFIFKNVLPFHMIWTILIVIPSMVLFGTLYYFSIAGYLQFLLSDSLCIALFWNLLCTAESGFCRGYLVV